MIIITFFYFFRKNESILDEANDTIWNANKILTTNSSQSNADDPIDDKKKVAERENVDDDKDFSSTVTADDSNNGKMSPNKDSSRFINDETKQKTAAPPVESLSGTKHTRQDIRPPSMDLIEGNNLSHRSRSSSPITESSIPKDLSLASKMKTRSPCISPERSTPSPMDTSPSPHKDYSNKGRNNIGACKS